MVLKIKDIPFCENLRDIRIGHMYQLLKIQGVVTRRFKSSLNLNEIYYICDCGARLGP